MGLYQLAIRRYIDRCIQQKRRVPTWALYLNVLIEVSVVTLMITWVRFEDAIFMLSAPPVLIYGVLIALTTLHLDTRIALFAGVVTAVEYLGLAFFVFHSLSDPTGIEPIYRQSFFYVSKAIILVLSGIGAAFVAHELRRRIVYAFQTIEENNRVEAAKLAGTAPLIARLRELVRQYDLDAILTVLNKIPMDDPGAE